MANHQFILNIKFKLIKNLTSEGIAQRFIEKFENIIFKIEETGDWRFYSGGYFKEISKSKIDGKILEIIKSIPEEAQGEKYLKTENGDIVEPKTLHAFRDEAINSNSIRKNAISLISSYKGILISEKAFDQKCDEIVVKNGILNLKTSELKDHNPGCMSTRITNVAYNKNAACPLFKKFIREITKLDQSLEKFLIVLFGYFMTCEIKEQKMYIFFGTGANGKSLLLNLVLKILYKYCKTGHSPTILKKIRTQASDLPRWRKARLVVLSEINPNEKLDEGVVKAITGGDEIVSRSLYKNYDSYQPEFKMVLIPNNLPSFEGTDDGIRRRLQVIPFLNKFTGEDADKNLFKKLIEESEGIFALLVEGAMEYYRNGIPYCEAVETATRNYLHEMDKVINFLEDKCIVEKNNKKYRTQTTLLWETYQIWEKENSDHKLKKSDLLRILKDKGYSKKKSGNLRYVEGIKLRLNITQN